MSVCLSVCMYVPLCLSNFTNLLTLIDWGVPTGTTIVLVGAYYYMYKASGDGACDNLAHGPMDAILESLIKSWAQLKLPVHSVQLDDWWCVCQSVYIYIYIYIQIDNNSSLQQ